MSNINKVISNKMWQVLDILRGTYDIEQSIKIAQEKIFLKLLPYSDNKYKEISKSDDLEVSLNNDTLIKNTLKYIFKITDEKELLERITEVLDDEEFNGICENNKSSDIFEAVVDFKYNQNKHIYYNTAPSINKLMSRIFKNKEFNTLYDPTIGTGILTKSMVKYHDNTRVYGQDISEDELNICKMMLILDGRIKDVENIKLGNTIINPMHNKEGALQKFDCIVSSPPLGVRDWGYNEVLDDKYNRFTRGMPTKSSGDYAFISHIVESMDDNGIAMIVVSGGTLFRGGVEGRIRKQLIEENLVDAIIALPNNTVYGTSIPVNLLILNKNKCNKETLFIDVLNNMESSRTLTIISDDMIEKIGNTYDQYRAEAGFSRLVGLDELEENEFNLSIARYVSAVKEESNEDVKAIKTDILELEVKLKKIQLELSKYM